MKQYITIHRTYHLTLLAGFILCICALPYCTLKKQSSFSHEVHDVLTPSDSVQWAVIVKKADDASSKGDLKTERTVLDEAIKFCKKNKYHIYLFQVFNIYAQRLYSYGEFEKGDKCLDSAAWVVNHYNIVQLKSQLNLAFAAKPQIVGTDSALYYYKAALEDTTYLPDIYKRMLYANLSRTYINKAYYKEAKLYAQKALDLIRQEQFDNRLANEIHMYQYFYLCEKGLKDTVAAFNILSKAYKIMMDSLDGKGDETICQSMGDYYFDKNKFDSALFFYTGFEKRMAETKADRMQIIPYILKAKVYVKLNNFEKAKALLNIVEKEGAPAKEILGSSALEYYETRYEVNKHEGKTDAAFASIEAARKIENETHMEEKSLALAALEEKLTQARAEKTIAEKEEKINMQRLYTIGFAVAAFLIGLIGLLLYMNQRRKKLLETQRIKTLEQQTVIEKANVKMLAENEERKRISKEIHDDIGPALTTLNMAANMINSAAANNDQSQPISLILQNTTSINNQINEIVWSLNSNNDNIQSLTAYIRKFATSFLQTAGIQLNFQSRLNQQNRLLEGYKRRNIFHSVKEVLNNAVKYSKASLINIDIAEQENLFIISIQDNGLGLPENMIYGNGLRNIEENITKLSGEVHLENNSGFSVRISVPLNDA
ncbi:MAG: hypothetical protein IT249_02255 [Chitinophagaceae bacterium]|nr:hypothetical protein [Chitinophagaceae bacterium]